MVYDCINIKSINNILKLNVTNLSVIMRSWAIWPFNETCCSKTSTHTHTHTSTHTHTTVANGNTTFLVVIADPNVCISHAVS
jgi:uncharacterized membrane protein YccF (DUF307 family)